MNLYGLQYSAPGSSISAQHTEYFGSFCYFQGSAEAVVGFVLLFTPIFCRNNEKTGTESTVLLKGKVILISHKVNHSFVAAGLAVKCAVKMHLTAQRELSSVTLPGFQLQQK